MGRAIDSLIVFRFLKLLVTPFKDTKAYELGIIDERGKNLRKARKSPDKPNNSTKIPEHPKLLKEFKS